MYREALVCRRLAANGHPWSVVADLNQEKAHGPLPPVSVTGGCPPELRKAHAKKRNAIR